MDTEEASETTDPLLFETPFNELLPRFQALEPDDIVAVNVDVPTAVATALGAQPKLLELTERLARALPEFDLELVSKLDDYAFALSHAQTLYSMASASASAELLQLLSKEGTALRETLWTDARTLVLRQLIDGRQLREVKGRGGYRSLAVDLQILAQVFRDEGARVEGKCATSVAEINRAEQLAAALLSTAGLVKHGQTTAAAAADLRARAFTVFTRAYDQIRRAMVYLRWNDGDVDAVAPSLYRGRGGHGKKKMETPEPVPPSPPPLARTQNDASPQPFLDREPFVGESDRGTGPPPDPRIDVR